MGREDRLLRQRVMDQGDLIDARHVASGSGGPPILCRTTTQGSYPTVAAKVFVCTIETVLGPLTENADPAFTADSGLIYVANLGAAVPPSGTYWLACPVPNGRFAARYDGTP